jgi:hypothetical protein
MWGFDSKDDVPVARLLCLARVYNTIVESEGFTANNVFVVGMAALYHSRDYPRTKEAKPPVQMSSRRFQRLRLLFNVSTTTTSKSHRTGLAPVAGELPVTSTELFRVTICVFSFFGRSAKRRRPWQSPFCKPLDVAADCGTIVASENDVPSLLWQQSQETKG